MSSEEVVDGPGDVDTAAISSTAPDDEKDDSGAEDRAAVCTSNPAHPFLAPPLEGDSSDSEPDLEQKRLWEELCHALYRDLPPPERKANLKQKVHNVPYIGRMKPSQVVGGGGGGGGRGRGRGRGREGGSYCQSLVSTLSLSIW